MIITGKKSSYLLIKNILILLSVYSFFFIVVTVAFINDGLIKEFYIPILVVFCMIFYILLNDCYQFWKAPKDIQFDLEMKQVVKNGGLDSFQFKDLFIVANDSSSKSYRVAIINMAGKEKFLTRHYYFDKSIKDITDYLSHSNASSIKVMSSHKYSRKVWMSR